MENKNKYRAVLFDLDDTLYDGSIPYVKAQDQILIFWQKKYSQFTINELRDEFEKWRAQTFEELRPSPSVGNRMIYIKKFFEYHHLPIDVEFLLEANKRYWNCFFRAIKIEKDLVSTLENIKSREMKVVVITGLTLEIQIQKIKKLNIHKYLDYMITAEEAGTAKPHPEIFEMVKKNIDTEFNEMIIVGDDIKGDIEGGKSLGLKTILIPNKFHEYTQGEISSADFYIKKLGEIPNILDNLNK